MPRLQVATQSNQVPGDKRRERRQPGERIGRCGILPRRAVWRTERPMTGWRKRLAVSSSKTSDKLVTTYPTISLEPAFSLQCTSKTKLEGDMCSNPCDQANRHRTHRISQANLLVTPSQPDHAPKDHTHTSGTSTPQRTPPRRPRPTSPTQHNTHKTTDTPPQASHNPHS